MHKIRNDLILIGCLVALMVVGIILYFTLQPKGDLKVYIYYDKDLYQVVDLDSSQEIAVNDVIVVIEDKEVYVRYSSCKDQICVHQGKIKAAGQTITCLPQRVFIQIEGSGVDVGI